MFDGFTLERVDVGAAELRAQARPWWPATPMPQPSMGQTGPG